MTVMEPIPVAVVGAGNMGSNHVRVYDQLPGAELVEVVEPDPDRARAVREEYDVPIIEDASELSRAAAATIAVPNRHHLPVAETCANKDIDLLVEKPIADSVEDAEAIVEVARDNDVALLIGHIERFNPAVRALREILEQETLIEIEAHRLGPFNKPLRDRNVVYDLMIHDLDIVRSLADGDVTRLNAIGTIDRSEENGAGESRALDHAIAQLKHDNGVLGVVTASHVTHGKVRTLAVTTRDAYITLDYQSQHVEIQRRGTEQTTSFLERSGYRSETVTETPFVPNREPLKNELEHFLDCVAGRAEPEMTGEEATEIVALAGDVARSIEGDA